MCYFEGDETSNNDFIPPGLHPGKLERWYLSDTSWNLSRSDGENSMDMG